MPQKTVPSLAIKSGEPPSARSFAASLRPASHVPPSRTRGSGNSSFERPSLARTGSAIRSSRFDPGKRGITKRQHFRVEEEAAVAILGKAGQLFDPRDLEARKLEGFDDRIAQPLRKLVKRHNGLDAIAEGRIYPGIAQVLPVQRRTARPDAAERINDRIENRSSLDRRAVTVLPIGHQVTRTAGAEYVRA